MSVLQYNTTVTMTFLQNYDTMSVLKITPVPGRRWLCVQSRDSLHQPDHPRPCVHILICVNLPRKRHVVVCARPGDLILKTTSYHAT